MSRPPKPDTLPQNVADIEQRVRTLETAPRLQNSSVKDATIPFYDAGGNLRLRVGKLSEDSYGVEAINPNEPPPPLVPAKRWYRNGNLSIPNGVNTTITLNAVAYASDWSDDSGDRIFPVSGIYSVSWYATLTNVGTDNGTVVSFVEKNNDARIGEARAVYGAADQWTGAGMTVEDTFEAGDTFTFRVHQLRSAALDNTLVGAAANTFVCISLVKHL